MEMHTEQIEQTYLDECDELPKGMTHSTWYQIETDIGVLQLWCKSCEKIFLCMAQAEHICPTCEKEGYFPEPMAYEQLKIALDTVVESSADVRTYDEEIDWDAEMATHCKLERKLRVYDWWFSERGQIQQVWYNLRYPLSGVNNNQASAQRYFEREYAVAYHRDDY